MNPHILPPTPEERDAVERALAQAALARGLSADPPAPTPEELVERAAVERALDVSDADAEGQVFRSIQDSVSFGSTTDGLSFGSTEDGSVFCSTINGLPVARASRTRVSPRLYDEHRIRTRESEEIATTLARATRGHVLEDAEDLDAVEGEVSVADHAFLVRYRCPACLHSIEAALSAEELAVLTKHPTKKGIRRLAALTPDGSCRWFATPRGMAFALDHRAGWTPCEHNREENVVHPVVTRTMARHALTALRSAERRAERTERSKKESL